MIWETYGFTVINWPVVSLIIVSIEIPARTATIRSPGRFRVPRDMDKVGANHAVWKRYLERQLC